MGETTTSTQIVREAEEIEDYKLRLLKEAEDLAFNVKRPTLSSQLPGYKVAGFTTPQQTALDAAKDTGVGSFKPYMTAANQALGGAYQTTTEAADMLRGADTRNQFTDAQRAMGQAGGAAANVTSGIGQINQGLGYLDQAAQRAAASDTTGQFGDARADLNTGLGALSKRSFPVLAGLGSQDNTSIFVSRGIGTVYVPVRINCPPEVALVTLRRRSEI